MSAHGISFFVEGTPIPQGSKTATRRGVMFEANKKTKPWREHVTRETKRYAGRFAKDTAVHVDYIFIFEKPKSVKRKHMSVKPDVDKLMRAINDSLTKAGVWGDDSRVTSGSFEKQYGYPAGVWLTIKEKE